jgi:hypothetical protein
MTLTSPERLSYAFIATLMLIALLLSAAAPRPARADGAASTRNIILGAAAVATGIFIYNNVQHKRAAARNTVVGYTRDGGSVYSDGRILYPNGRTLYASNGNGRACGYDGVHERCGARPLAYYSQTDDRDRHARDNGHHRGWGHQRGHADKGEHGRYDHHDGREHDHGASR